MRVVIKFDLDDDERRIIAGEIDERIEKKKIGNRKATREEIRDYVAGALELRLSGSREQLEDELEWSPEKFVRGYRLPELGY